MCDIIIKILKKVYFLFVCYINSSMFIGIIIGLVLGVNLGLIAFSLIYASKEK